MMDRFYQAVLLQYRAATEYTVTGDMRLTLGNKVPFGVQAYFSDPALSVGSEGLKTTDYLLLGKEEIDYQLQKEDKTDPDNPKWIDGEKVKSTPVFYIYNDAADAAPAHYVATDTDFSKGKAARLEYFASADAFKYFTNMKLYYRADVSNYEGNTSNKMTERNMYYQTVGTIQTLGARTIHDAIYSEQNTMKVDVTVNKWKLSINQVPM